MSLSSPETRDTLPGVRFRVSGNWAHFKKPETNNNPLSHDFITKTALLGLVGAVLGVERGAMRSLFPQWSEDFLYGVQVRKSVKKQSWAFTMRNVANPSEKAPRPMELLCEPEYTVLLACRNERSAEALQQFTSFLREGRAVYTPVLGLHNCPAELEFEADGTLARQKGSYTTRGFALLEHRLDGDKFDFSQFRLGIERIPKRQDDDWWNPPKDYADVYYADSDHEIALSDGEFFRFEDRDDWCLI